MLYRSDPVEMVVWGELGMFTKPEFRTDRVSYPIVPPTAALGMFRSVSWHPEAEIHEGKAPRLGIEVEEIQVLNPIKTVTMRVNEIGNLPTPGKTLVAHGSKPYTGNVMQTTLHLVKEPKYLIRATYVSNDSWHVAKKGVEMFKRRLKRGGCHRQPYLGRRGYMAHVRKPTEGDVPLDINLDLGKIPWRIEYGKGGRKRLHTFDARLRRGVLVVPSFLDAAYKQGREIQL